MSSVARLVTRFGADPLLDLEVANKRYVDNSGGVGLQVWGNVAHDTITNTEANTFFSLNSASGTTNRRFVPAVAGTLALLGVLVALNNNTADGAFYRLRVADADVNGQVIFDQATGFFQDVTNSDTFVLGDVINWQYTQGNNSIDMYACTITFNPT